MGAWGYQPMENDAGQDWVADQVEHPLLAVIERTLRTYLDESDAGMEAGDNEYQDIEDAEAEACVALLVDLTSKETRLKYRTVDLRYGAKARGLWDLALRAVDKLLAEECWVGWNDEQRKRAMFQELRADLERVKDENKDMMV